MIWALALFSILFSACVAFAWAARPIKDFRTVWDLMSDTDGWRVKDEMFKPPKVIHKTGIEVGNRVNCARVDGVVITVPKTGRSGANTYLVRRWRKWDAHKRRLIRRLGDLHCDSVVGDHRAASVEELLEELAKMSTEARRKEEGRQ